MTTRTTRTKKTTKLEIQILRALDKVADLRAALEKARREEETQAEIDRMLAEDEAAERR